MDILYLISYAGKAGTEKYVLDRIDRCTAQNHRCHLVYQEAGELSRIAESRGLPTHRLDMRPTRVISAARKLAAYCRREGVSVIHAQYPRENVIALLSRLFDRDVRVVFTSHLTVRQGLRWRLLNRLLTPFDSAVIAVCKEVGALLRQNGVPARRIHVIPNGIVPRPLPERENRIRQEFHLQPDCFVFFTMARYAPEKGLNVLLEALALLKAESQRPFVCAIAGDGELFEEIGEQVRALGLSDSVLRLGYRADAAALLPSADAYVSSALYNEAMSFGILEAMAAGLPLVTTDVGAGRELSEGCGFCAPPGDAKALDEYLLKLLENKDLCCSLGRRARERVTEEYNGDTLAQRVMKIYNSVDQKR